MSETIHALAALEAKGKLTPHSFDPGDLGHDQVEIEVDYCGVCRSDVAMLNNEFRYTKYPLVPGHEVIGRVVAVGGEVHGLPGEPGNPMGKTVGLGWYSGSCMMCAQCMEGDQNLCQTAEQTIVGRPGGFATRVRTHWGWAIPLPRNLDAAKAGPLFCGGITVFNPIVQHAIRPTDRVGVIGIGGLGHLAVQFLNKWGCEVHAFSSNPEKVDEIRGLGAHHVIDSKSAPELAKVAGKLDFLMSTVNASLDWNAMLGTLAPRGILHFVGIVPKPIPVPVAALIMTQKSVAGSPLGSPATTARMLDFCGRHGIAAVTETYKMSQANDAIEHLEAGKARYRLVLENDLR